MKDAKLFLRLDAATKAWIDAEAERRGESASFVVREALRHYLATLPTKRAALPVVYPPPRLNKAGLNEPRRT